MDSQAQQRLRFLALVLGATVGAALGTDSPAPTGSQPLPPLLSETGLIQGVGDRQIRAQNLPFTPQYPLWSDGTTKRRWISLPPGTTIDASRSDAWEFPRGTRLWKEFSFGRPIETRLIERLANGSWRYATYVWKEDGSDAVLAPLEGMPALAVSGAPGGKYPILSEADCRACHEPAPVPALGFSALQLSSDADPLAPNRQARATGDLDLHALVSRGLVRNLAADARKTPPRIAAATPTARAALGYLHANCGHCHNQSSSDPLVPVSLSLAQPAVPTPAASAAILASVVGVAGSYRMPGSAEARLLIAPGQPERSVLALRMRSRNPQTQMPPLGTRVADAQGLALVDRWISEMPPPAQESSP